VKLSVCCRRFDPAISRLQQRAHAGEIGKLHILKSCSRDHPQPSDGYIAISGLWSLFVYTKFVHIVFILALMVASVKFALCNCSSHLFDLMVKEWIFYAVGPFYLSLVLLSLWLLNFWCVIMQLVLVGILQSMYLQVGIGSEVHVRQVLCYFLNLELIVNWQWCPMTAIAVIVCHYWNLHSLAPKSFLRWRAQTRHKMSAYFLVCPHFCIVPAGWGAMQTSRLAPKLTLFSFSKY